MLSFIYNYNYSNELNGFEVNFLNNFEYDELSLILFEFDIFQFLGSHFFVESDDNDFNFLKYKFYEITNQEGILFELSNEESINKIPRFNFDIDFVDNTTYVVVSNYISYKEDSFTFCYNNLKLDKVMNRHNFIKAADFCYVSYDYENIDDALYSLLSNEHFIFSIREKSL